MPGKILVVEDDVDIQTLLKNVLEKHYEVRTAGDGLRALALVNEGFRPDLIIADIMMPLLDGMTMVKALKKRQDTAKIHVIFLTAKSSPADVVQGINVGARHYLTKPFKVEDLLSKVKKLVPG